MHPIIADVLDGDTILATGVVVSLGPNIGGAIAEVHGTFDAPANAPINNGSQYRLVATDGRVATIFVNQVSIFGAGNTRVNFRLVSPFAKKS